MAQHHWRRACKRVLLMLWIAPWLNGGILVTEGSYFTHRETTILLPLGIRNKPFILDYELSKVVRSKASDKTTERIVTKGKVYRNSGGSVREEFVMTVEGQPMALVMLHDVQNRMTYMMIQLRKPPRESHILSSRASNMI